MNDIPEQAVEAGLEDWIEYTDDHDRGTFTGEALVKAILERAEKAWPHNPPQRDPASTTYSTTEHTYHGYYRAPASAKAKPFGFGVTKL